MGYKLVAWFTKYGTVPIFDFLKKTPLPPSGGSEALGCGNAGEKHWSSPTPEFGREN